MTRDYDREMDRDGAVPFACAAARHTLHERLDGAMPGGAEMSRLEQHLATCPDCREFADDMALILGGLAAMPDPELPAEDLAAVWNRTVDAPAAIREDARRRRRWRVALVAAAAVVGTAMLLPVLRESPGTRDPELSPAEIARTAAEVQYVFKLTDRALQRTQRVALDQAIDKGVRPALQRIPLLDDDLTGSTRRN